MSEEDLNSNQELKDLANGVKMTQGELNKAFDKNKIKLGKLKQHYRFPCDIYSFLLGPQKCCDRDSSADVPFIFPFEMGYFGSILWSEIVTETPK